MMLKEGAPSRKRKAPQEVTSNACTECRRKRAKCDGKQPCSRCASREGLHCVYDVHLRTAKQTMKTEIDKLRAQSRITDRILQALASGEQTQKILSQLKNNEGLQNIVDSLGPESSRRGTGDTERKEEEEERERDVDDPGVEEGHQGRNSPESSRINIGKQRVDLPRSRTSDEGQSEASSHGDMRGFSVSRGMSTMGLTTSSNASFDAYSADVDMDEFTISTLRSSSAAQLSPHYPSATSSERQMLESSAASARSPTDGFEGDERTARDALSEKAMRDLEEISQASNDDVDLDFDSDLGPSSRDQASRFVWTNVIQEEKIVQHLLNLYFCWEYPTFASLSKKHFFHDFYRGKRRYCSSLLVNALSCLGARFSKSRAVRGRTNANTVGEQFFEECKRLLEADEGKLSLPTVQALGLMSLREASCGRNAVSLSYSRRSMQMALEMQLEKDLTHLDGVVFTSTEREVRAATFWGCFTLEQAWSLCLGRTPQAHRSVIQVHKPAVVEEIEQREWIPYTDEGMPTGRSWRQPSNIRSVYKSFCELSEVVHDTLFTLYKPEGRLTSQKILDCYTRLLNWYSSLPDVLRLGQNFTPSVLFTHMYYHFALLLLFRPFIKLIFIGSAVTPREICTQAAESISSLVRSYHNLYTLACTPSFVPYIVLTASIMHLLDGNTVLGPAYFLKGVDDLSDMSDCHGFARRAIEILRYLAKKWAPSVPYDRSAFNDPEDSQKSSTSLSISTMDFFTLISDESLPKLEGTNIITLADTPIFAIFANQGVPLLRTSDPSQPEVESDSKRKDIEKWLNIDGFSIVSEDTSHGTSKVPHTGGIYEGT